jgi:autotransporter passenger strand-loop-strand repeat protein
VSIGGVQIISAGGSANSVSISGTQNISGGTDINGRINSGGIQSVLAGGSASATLVSLSGYQIVSTGGTALAASIYGVQNIFSGGLGVDGTVNDGGVQNVSSSGLASATIILNGGLQVVSAGAVASATLIYGAQDIIGGTDIAATISFAGSQNISAGGVASATLVSSGGVQSVLAGGSAKFATITGVQNILNSGVDISATINSGGTQTISSGGIASATVVNSGGSQTLSAGATVSSATIYGVQNILSGGVDLSGAIQSGGVQNIASGGIASGGAVNDGGTQNVSSGAAAISTTINSGGTQNLYSGGIASAVLVGSGAIQNISSGAIVMAVVISSTQNVSSGGVSNKDQITSNGTQNVGAGASAVSTTINGSQNVSGGATSASQVNSGGVQTVSSGGTASASQINSGGVQAVAAGGVAVNGTVNGGGQLVVGAGGLVSSTTVNSGGVVNVGAGGSSFFTQIGNGGVERILSGGFGPSAFIFSGGSQIIDYGGVDVGTTVYKGGVQTVFGIASGAVLSGGTQVIHSGGSGVSGVLYDGGVVIASAGGNLLSYIISGNSASILAIGATVGSATPGENAITVLGARNTVLLDSATLLGNIGFAGSANTLTLANSTTIASGLSLLDDTSANTLVLANQTLSAYSDSTIKANVGSSVLISGWNTVSATSGSQLLLAGNISLGGASSYLAIDSTSYLGLTTKNAASVKLTAGQVQNAGTLGVGAGQTLTLSGTYLQQGGTYQVGIGPNTSAGLFNVTGVAALAQASIAPVLSSVSPTVGSRYPVLSAGTGLIGRFASVTQPVDVLADTQFIALQNVAENKRVDLAVIPKAYTRALAGNTDNIYSLAKTYDSLVENNVAGTQTRNQLMLLDALARQTQSSLPDFTQSLKGEIYPAAVTVTYQASQRVQQSVIGHLDDLTTAPNGNFSVTAPRAQRLSPYNPMVSPVGAPGPEVSSNPSSVEIAGMGLANRKVWGELVTQYMNRSSDNIGGGAQAYLYQATFGGDFYQNDETRLGAGFTLGKSTLKANQYLETGNVQQYSAFGYGRTKVHSVVLDAMVMFGVNTTDISRSDPTGWTRGLSVKGISGQDGLASVGMSYPLVLPEMTFTPYARATWQYQVRAGLSEGLSPAALTVDRYSGSGARAVIGLQAGSNKANPMRDQYTYRFNFAVGADTPGLANPSVGTSLAGYSGAVSAAQVGSVFVQTAMYGTARLSAGTYGYAGISVEARRGQIVAGGTLGIKIEF